MSSHPLKARTREQSMSYGATVSIAATSSGVAGNITIPSGAHLVALDFSFTGAAGGIPVIFALSWTGSPNPLNFTPNLASVFATPGAAISTLPAYAIPLDVIAKNVTSITVTITSTANVTVVVGVRWV